MPEEKVVEKIEEQPEKKDEKPEWDKERQRADQAEANLRKTLEEKGALQQEVETTSARLEELETQLAELQKPKDDAVELDPHTADIPDIVKEITGLRKELKDAKSQLAEQGAKIDGYESAAQKDKAEQESKDRIEQVLGPLDEEFGAKYRNAAQKLANDKIEKGEAEKPGESRPGDIAFATLQASRLMRQCYKELYDKDQKKEEETPTDTGEGGVNVTSDAVQPAKSRTEALADLRKRGKPLNIVS